MSIPNLLLAVVSVSSVGCNSGQQVSENIRRETPQADDLSSKSDTKITSPVSTTAAQGKTVHIGAIDWYVDYDAAMNVAKDNNKPIWLHFGENPG